MAESLMVGMAEIKVAVTPNSLLLALGLGSCIGICAYDAEAGVAGLAHVVLPDSAGDTSRPGKFADTAIPSLLAEMVRYGAKAGRIKVALAGGAQLFAFDGSGPRLEIGARNAEAVQHALEQSHIPVVASDLGGHVGRTVNLLGNGQVRVKTIGQGDRELVSLGRAGDSPAAPNRILHSETVRP